VKLPTNHKILVPYVTAGVTADWTAHVLALIDAGADAVEIGLPFSDPTLDGPTIAAAVEAALRRGTSLRRVLDELPGIAGRVPLVASTYANLAIRPGACAALRDAGFEALIVPDLPLEEAAEVQDIDLVLLASPASSDERLAEIVRRSRGFVYAVSVMGTTGERDDLAASAAVLAGRLKQHTTGRYELPVLLGFGISGPTQAAEAARVADGIVIGAAVMRRVLDGATPAETGAYLRSIRQAI
jgi:tryptophan synthase alpha chain